MKNNITDQIISCLIKENLITEKQLHHAEKVKSKIISSKRLLDVLKELNYVDDEQIKSALAMHKNTFKIGELLVEFGYLTNEKLEAALKIKKKSKEKRFGEILIEQRFIQEDDFLDLLSVQLGFPHIDLDISEIDNDLVSKGSIKWFRKYTMLPLYIQNNKPLIAFADPFSKISIEGASEIFGNKFNIAVSSQNAILSTLNKLEHGSKKK